MMESQKKDEKHEKTRTECNFKRCLFRLSFAWNVVGTLHTEIASLLDGEWEENKIKKSEIV